jgi:hypothetical protein
MEDQDQCAKRKDGAQVWSSKSLVQRYGRRLKMPIASGGRSVIWQFRGLVGVSWTCAFLEEKRLTGRSRQNLRCSQKLDHRDLLVADRIVW